MVGRSLLDADWGEGEDWRGVGEGLRGDGPGEMMVLGAEGQLGAGVAGEVLVGGTGDLVGVWATECMTWGCFRVERCGWSEPA